MADDTQSLHSINGNVDWGRAKKYHEGWVHIKPLNGKDWKPYWIVLRGSVLFICSSQKTLDKTAHIGSLPLGPDTEIEYDKKGDGKRKGYKFEIQTTSSNGSGLVNKFKFDKENDRELWHAYIMGIAKGIAPTDSKLLPGQKQDVVEAVKHIQSTPPPLPPTIPRPKTMMRPSQSQPELDDYPMSVSTAQINFGQEFNGSTRSNGSNGSGSSGASGHFQSHVTMKRNNSMPADMADGNGFDNLRQLMQRQSDLATKALGSLTLDSYNNNHSKPSSAHTVDHAATVYRSDSHEHRKFSEPVIEYHHTPAMHHPTPTTHHQSPPTMGFHRSVSANNAHEMSGVIHQFYMDSDRNREHPSWFFENLSREEAESILTVGKRFGNVLMRESVTFKNTGSYVISMRREVHGGTNLNHYEVRKTPKGFMINVDNAHSPMKCLSEVIDFFTTVAGVGTQPMRTNDRTSYGLSFPASAPAGSPARRMIGADNDSGFGDHHDPVIDHLEDMHVPSPPVAPPPPAMPQTWMKQPDVVPTPTTKKGAALNIAGAVAPEIQQRVKEIQSQLTLGHGHRNSAGSMASVPSELAPEPPFYHHQGDVYENNNQYHASEYGRQPAQSYVPAPPPPPMAPPMAPPAPPMPGGYGAPSQNYSPSQNYNPGTLMSQRSYAPQSPGGGMGYQHQPDVHNNWANTRVPAKLPPMTTLQRSAGHSDTVDNRENVYLNQEYLEDHSSRYRQPTVAAAPPPPPAMPPGGFNTTRPDFNRGQAAQGYGAGHQQQQQQQQQYGGYYGEADQSAMQPGNFSTTPAGGRRPSGARNQGFGGGGGALSFEDELARKLKVQHDVVYASGVEIRRANWN